MKNKIVFLTCVFVLCVGSAGFGASADASEMLDLEAYAGKVVVVDFWASWCVPCRRSFPWLNRMQAKYANDGLVVIAVNVDTERAEADRFLSEYPADFLVHFDNDALLAKTFGVEAMPSSYVIGRNGAIVAQHLGFKVRKQEEYEAVLAAALGEEP